MSEFAQVSDSTALSFCLIVPIVNEAMLWAWGRWSGRAGDVADPLWHSHGCAPCFPLPGYGDHGRSRIDRCPQCIGGRNRWIQSGNSGGGAAASAAQETCGSPEEFTTKNCQLSWAGLTVYGTIDAGAMWQCHGTPHNGMLPAGVETVISKNSNRALWNLAPGVLSQSNIGLRGSVHVGSGWAAIFDVQGGFNPYLLQWANGPGSVAQNACFPLTSQTSNGDSNREGHFYNSVGYLGLRSPYGTLTIFRQNALTLDGVIAYDPLVGSYAFSPIGYQGFACGAGVPETCRLNTSAKYRIDVGQFRFAALWQFAGYDEGNPSIGSYQLQFGADLTNVAGGTFSFDVIGAYVKKGRRVSHWREIRCRPFFRRY